jgi:two-component system, cell cycle sensor histidine kinase and response regulator CckA
MRETHTPEARTILLAEDELLLRELGETILTQAGYKVLTAPAGKELRVLVGEYSGNIDLLLTDVGMPGMDGHELAGLVKQRWPQARVLYMSGYSREEIQFADNGAVFLQKPFTPTELIRKIDEMMQQPGFSASQP